ncbi:MAG TPA: FkbM family methyltransferase [Candidatus Sulfotelmatobacter sp.]|jgi:FkbM family methyltransferase|nr:FkbM family methyltransferase [Candidatus Sulfotelmatobacter sp.]
MTNASKASQLDEVLNRIRSESREAARERERNAFAKFAGPYQDRLILFGAGPFGRLVLPGLEQAGIRPIAFADNNERLWETEIGGVPVLPPSTAAERYRDSACFVVTIYNGSPVRRQLKSLGCKYVAPPAALFWKYGEIFTPNFGIELPHKLPVYADEIRACHETLADEESRRELVEQLEWRCFLDDDFLPRPLDPKDTYFPLDLITPSENEVFVDCGSFQGDIFPSFTSHWNSKFRHIFAVEPDPQNAQRLPVTAKSMGLTDQVTVLPYALSDHNGTVSFASTGTMGSKIVEGGEQSISVECRKLDDLSWPLAPTYLKMDIEGAEPKALVGASNLLRRHHPILAVCTYHRSEHLWQIPNIIRSIEPEYNLFLRRYAEDCWEGVCYAIPDNRLKRA